jgi:hypothetical protein
VRFAFYLSSTFDRLATRTFFEYSPASQFLNRKTKAHGLMYVLFKLNVVDELFLNASRVEVLRLWYEINLDEALVHRKYREIGLCFTNVFLGLSSHTYLGLESTFTHTYTTSLPAPFR